MVSYLIDAVLAVMLVTATVYLVIVNKRLRVLQSGQSEINALIGQFSRTIDETDASVRRMVAAASEVSGSLAQNLDRSKGVKEDMTLLLDSAERTARRIEESVSHARSLVRRLDGAPVRPMASPVPAAQVPETTVADAGGEPVMAPPPPSPPNAARDEAPGGEPVEPVNLFRPPAIADRPEAEKAPAKPANPFYARLRTLGTEV